MGAKLKKELGIDAQLNKGRGGVFDVVADEKLVFSKHKEGRFPDDDEVVDAIRALK